MEAKKEKGLSTSFIKTIALVCMFIDHFAASVVACLLRVPSHPVMQQIGQWIPEGTDVTTFVMTVYQWMRNIGRISFPIYCFFIVEGFFHTRSRKKYARRLAACALISELPFDLALFGKVIYPLHQNVFFTLLIGLGAIWVIDVILAKNNQGKAQKALLATFTAVGFMLLAEIMFVDYFSFGVMVIVVMYLLRKVLADKVKLWVPIVFVAGVVVLSVSYVGEFWALLALPLMFFYRGKKGWNGKWFFYLFYPVHLVLLALAVLALGVQNWGIL